MLIPFAQIQQILRENQIHIAGALHVGAHECEELPFYINALGLKPEDIIWIDAIPQKVTEARNRGIPNVYHAVVTDQDDQDIAFHVSNNGQSSSVLEFGTHAQEHPWVKYISTIHQQSITLKTFFERNQIPHPPKYDFWNFDIQGAELMALKGAAEYIPYAKALYLEVNEKELYQGCGLIQDIDAFLATYQFKRAITKMTPHGWGDALYIRA